MLKRKLSHPTNFFGLIRRSSEFLSAEAMKQLFVAVVGPNLEFGKVVWSSRLEKDKNLNESVQRKGQKFN
jgi:hypothetical protein